MEADALFTFTDRRQPRHLLLSVLINTITAISNLNVRLQSRVKQENYNVPQQLIITLLRITLRFQKYNIWLSVQNELDISSEIRIVSVGLKIRRYPVIYFCNIKLERVTD